MSEQLMLLHLLKRTWISLKNIAFAP